ncbi:hypothetical protein D3C84_826860 [compost metagenome]
MSNIERIDLGTGDAGSTLSLTAEAIELLTDTDNELQIGGDSFDTLNIVGAVQSGSTTTVDGVAYDQYVFGSATLLVEQDINVVV